MNDTTRSVFRERAEHGQKFFAFEMLALLDALDTTERRAEALDAALTEIVGDHPKLAAVVLRHMRASVAEEVCSLAGCLNAAVVDQDYCDEHLTDEERARVGVDIEETR